MVHNSNDAERAARGGAVAGVLAGALLTGMMTLMAAIQSHDVWYGMKGAAAPLLGNRAVVPGFDLGAVLLGLSIHFAVSAFWGVGFGLLFYGLRKGLTVVAGVLWSFVVWLGMYYVALPLVGLTYMTHEAPLLRVIVYHLAFGIPLAVAFLAYQPKITPIRPRLHRTVFHGV